VVSWDGDRYAVCSQWRTASLSPMAYPNEIIIKDPEIVGGMPVFRGTRVPFKNLLDYLEGGHTLDEFLDDFHRWTREAAIAALKHAKELVIARAQ